MYCWTYINKGLVGDILGLKWPWDCEVQDPMWRIEWQKVGLWPGNSEELTWASSKTSLEESNGSEIWKLAGQSKRVRDSGENISESLPPSSRVVYHWVRNHAEGAGDLHGEWRASGKTHMEEGLWKKGQGIYIKTLSDDAGMQQGRLRSAWN